MGHLEGILLFGKIYHYRIFFKFIDGLLNGNIWKNVSFFVACCLGDFFCRWKQVIVIAVFCHLRKRAVVLKVCFTWREDRKKPVVCLRFFKAKKKIVVFEVIFEKNIGRFVYQEKFLNRYSKSSLLKKNFFNLSDRKIFKFFFVKKWLYRPGHYNQNSCMGMYQLSLVGGGGNNVKKELFFRKNGLISEEKL